MFKTVFFSFDGSIRNLLHWKRRLPIKPISTQRNSRTPPRRVRCRDQGKHLLGPPQVPGQGWVRAKSAWGMGRASDVAAAQPWWTEPACRRLYFRLREHQELGLISCPLDLEGRTTEIPCDAIISSPRDMKTVRSKGLEVESRDDQDHPGPPSIQSSPLKGPGV